MRILTLPCGPIMANSYIVWNEETPLPAPCVVIDPADGALLLDTLKEKELQCVCILITHGHFDHIAGLYALKTATGAPVCVHQDDAAMLENDRLSEAYTWHFPQQPVHADRFLKDGDVIDAAGYRFRVLHTPGHTAGGVLYVVDSERLAFTGDTVFLESVGRTDLPGGNARALINSFFTKVLSLDGDYRLLPGHEEETSVAHEAQHNPLVAYRRSPWFS